MWLGDDWSSTEGKKTEEEEEEDEEEEAEEDGRSSSRGGPCDFILGDRHLGIHSYTAADISNLLHVQPIIRKNHHTYTKPAG